MTVSKPNGLMDMSGDMGGGYTFAMSIGLCVVSTIANWESEVSEGFHMSEMQKQKKNHVGYALMH